MSLTLVNLNLIKKDFNKTYTRIAGDKQVQRETDYYKANIGKVTSAKEFLANDRLYQFAMKSYGMEDMIYAKGFMKKVLESDLSDANSFANKLTDDRYRKFALAFNFGTAATAVQTQAQKDDVLGLYDQSIVNENDQVAEDTRYYQTMIGTFSNVDQMLGNERVRTYILKNFGFDPDRYSYSQVRNILTSDVTDPNSFVNQMPTSTTAEANGKARALNLVNAFNFNTDGTVKAAGVQTAEQTASVVENYVLTVPDHKTPSAAAVQRLYWDTKIKTATNVTAITGDSRMWDFVKTALELDATFTKAAFENIVTSDLNDPGSYVNTQSSATLKEKYTNIARMFNFATDGTAVAGNAQNSTQENTLLSGYNTHYDDADEAIQATYKLGFKNGIDSIKKVDDLFGTSAASIRTVVFAAFGIEQGEFIDSDIKKALTSDLSDPKSFVNRLGDPRLIKMAQDFNFDAKGNITTPRMAQSQATIQETAKNYIIQKTRFLKSPELDTAKTKANDESKYYQEQVPKLKTVDDLLKNRRLLDFTLVAAGIDPKTITDDTAKKLFKSDLSDPKSFANTQSDKRLRQVVTSFNFDVKGNLIQNRTSSVQDRGHEQQIVDGYIQNELETKQGEDNPGVRLALYFERKAQTITSAYDIIGDKALLEVFKTTYSMPDGFSNMKVEQQKAIVEKKLNMNDLKDPEKVKKLIQRFAVMYDTASDSASSPVSLLSSGGSISANMLYAASQSRTSR